MGDIILATGRTDGFVYRRRPTRVVLVGDVGIGGDNPIRVQSMTTTRTLDTTATVAQAIRLAEAGCEIVRITAPTVDDAANLREIKRQLRAAGVGVPLVADIHFNPRAALEAARWVEKVRIDPGNYADSRVFARREYSDAEYVQELERIEERLLPLVNHCREYGVALRIGTNHGSLSDRITSRFGDTPLGMVESALEFVRICERHGYRAVILSMKASNPKVMVQAYRLLADRMAAEGMDYPFHLGVTEAGSGVEARVKSAAGIGALLDDGIGDTIRVSLAEEPEAEIPVAGRLADLYATPAAGRRLAPVTRPIAGFPAEQRNPVEFRRRPTRSVRFGPAVVGAGLPLVAADATLAVEEPELLDELFSRDTAERAWPDLVEVRLDSPAIGPTAAGVAGSIEFVRGALAALGVTAGVIASAPVALVERLVEAAAHADGVKLNVSAAESTAIAEAAVQTAVGAARARRVPLWLEVAEAAGDPAVGAEPDWAGASRVAAELAALAEALGENSLVVGVRSSDHSRAIRAIRSLAAQLDAAGRNYPIAVGVAAGATSAVELPAGGWLPLDVPIAVGSLLADGLGDLVQVSPSDELPSELLGEADRVRLAYDCLQAAGARTFKAEIVACPSCGRTLFDLQTTSERIKARTGHLVGVKIAVMGCVVNGPGELADADFGYMGGAPGRVNLFVGRECVEKNVPAEEADERLIELVRQHGRWVDPPAG